MNYTSLDENILLGLIIVGVVIIAILRFAGGLAAAAGSGRFQMSMIPARLRRFPVMANKRRRAQTEQLILTLVSGRPHL